MKITPVKTDIIQPPKDDLLKAIKNSNLEIKERSVVVISSKVVAISEGRTVPKEGIDKEELVKQESDVFIKTDDSRWRICIKHGTFIGSAGIDESNANNHYILLPKNPQQSAKYIHEFLSKEYGIKDFGVIVADSRSLPLRYGSMGVALGWHGFEPIAYYTGKPDLFGRLAKHTKINIVDSLAAAGGFVMGDLSEQTPLSLIEDIPHIKFTNRDTSGELNVPPREDVYWPVLKKFFE